MSSNSLNSARPTVVQVVGTSGSGKTTLIERLIPRLAGRGLRVGVIKHAHEGFSLDQHGKDSQRCWDAGAQAVLVAAPQELFVRQRLPAPQSDAARQAGRAWSRVSELLERVPPGLDCVLIEGFARAASAIDVPVAVQVEITAEGVRLNGRLVASDAAALGAVEDAIVESLQGAHRQAEHHRAARRERLQQVTEDRRNQRT